MKISMLCRASLAVVVALASTALASSASDRPLKVIQTTEVRLTDSLDPAVPTKGEVRLLILVDDVGEIRDLLLLGSTHSDFTRAAVQALQEWEFEPARSDDEPVWSRSTIRMFFDARGRVVSITGAEMMSSLLGKQSGREFTSRLVREAELDSPLQVVSTVRPRFPIQLVGKVGERASVLLDFYIDEEGRPRMPVAVRSAHPFLTEAAMNALDRWRFAPPMSERHPVVVRARQEFVFLATEAVEESAAVAAGDGS